jgi:hypothetical protein
MSENKPITEEELWGVPPNQLPDPEAQRNFFDEHQPIGPMSGPSGQEKGGD